MKIKSITLHNFRLIKHASINLYDYSILVGANNTGKTSFLTALRIFYEDDIKYDEKRDFPKFPVDDNESWIDITYQLTNDEFNSLKDAYKSEKNILKVRRYFKSNDPERVKPAQSNIFGYENGALSKNLFYGAKNISQAKLGNVIYIPEIAETDETLKLSGPSPLRKIMDFIVKKVVTTSKSFQELTRTFEDFDAKFREEQSEDGISLQSLEKEINHFLKEWRFKFGLNINPLKPEEIVKNLVSHSLFDENLNEEINIRNVGQGLQRHLIFTLLRLSSRYVERKEYTKKEFSPEFTLLLFEEPEAFLHPCQQESLNRSLEDISSGEGQQTIISTHSPIFVSKNIDKLPSLIKFRKSTQGVTTLHQLSEKTRDIITEENSQLAQYLKSKLDDPTLSDTAKRNIKNQYLCETDKTRRMEE
ncbi:MAG: ATP-dependent nuclease [Candidatus Bathyarchaeales archaeon]